MSCRISSDPDELKSNPMTGNKNNYIIYSEKASLLTDGLI